MSKKNNNESLESNHFKLNEVIKKTGEWQDRHFTRGEMLYIYNLLKAEHARRWSLNEGDAIETGCSLQTLIKKVQIILTC